jgi:hypothetical protein
MHGVDNLKIMDVFKSNSFYGFRLPPPCKLDLLAGMLRSVEWPLVTEVSGQLIGPIFKVQATTEECRQHLGEQSYGEVCTHSSWTASPLKMGPIGCPRSGQLTTNLRCVISQKSKEPQQLLCWNVVSSE